MAPGISGPVKRFRIRDGGGGVSGGRRPAGDVIVAFGVDGGPRSLRLLAETAGVPRPTARRVLITLAEHALETPVAVLTEQHLPHLIAAADAISADLRLWERRPIEVLQP